MLVAPRIGGLARPLILRDAVDFQGSRPHSLAVGLGRAGVWSRGFGVGAVGPARCAVAKSVVDPDGLDHFEAETSSLFRGVGAANDFKGYLGTAFANHPATGGEDM